MREIEENRNISESGRASHAGMRLYQSILTSNLDSLRPRVNNLFQLSEIDSVVFVGSSASGKSTIQDAVVNAAFEDPILAGKISVPRRFVTRAPRPDDGAGIIYAKPENLPTKASNGELSLYGIKTMEGGRVEPFGLERSEYFPILFANNVVVKNPENILYPDSILRSGLIVGIYTPDRIREERLRSRSPELFETKPEEAAFRLSEEERSAIVIPRAHVIVKNFGDYENRSTADVVKLLRLVVSPSN